MKLLAILGVLFLGMIIIIPLVEKYAKPVSNEQMQNYHKIFGFLLGLLVLASALKYFMG